MVIFLTVVMFLFPKTMKCLFFSVNTEEDKKDSVLKCSFADLGDFCLGELISSSSFLLSPSPKVSCLPQI